VKDDVPSVKSCRRHSRLWWIAHAMLVPTLLLVLAALWLATGYRSLPIATPFIEQELNRQVSPSVTNIDGVLVHLDAARGTLVVEVQGISILDAQRTQEHIHFPAIRMRLVTRPLLRGRLKLRELGIVKPVIMVNRDEEGAVKVAVAAQDEVKTADAGMAVESMLAGLQRLGLRSVKLHDGEIRFASKGRTAVLHAPLVTLGVARSHKGGVEVSIALSLQTAEKSAYLEGNVWLKDKQQGMDVSARWQDVPLVTFAPLHPALSVLDDSNAEVSGNVSATLNNQAKLLYAEANITHMRGSLNDEKLFADSLNIEDMRAQVVVEREGELITLKKLYLKAPKGAFFEGSAKAEFIKAEDRVETQTAFDDILIPEYEMQDVTFTPKDGYVISAQLQAYLVSLADLKHYWPSALAPMSRAWVVANITEGRIPQAQLNVHITPEMLLQRPLPPEFLSAAIQVEGATVHYLSTMPSITDINGVVSFTGNRMDVEAVSGKTLNQTSVHNAFVSIPDFFDLQHGIPLEVDASLASNGTDIATALDEQHLHLARSVQLRADALQGTVDGRLQLHLPLYSGAIVGNTKPFDELVDYRVDAKLEGVTQDKIQGKWDISKLKGSFLAQKGEVVIEGSGAINKVPLTIKVRNALVTPAVDAEHEAIYETRYQVKGNATPEQLQVLGVGKIPLVSGVLGVDAEIVETNQQPTMTKATIDLRDANVEIPVLQWQKPRGVAASASFVHHADAKQDMLQGLVLKSSGLFIQGDVDIAKRDNEISRLALAQFRYGHSDLRVDYRHENGGAMRITLSGAVADVSPWVGDEEDADKPLTPEQKQQQAQPIEDPTKKLHYMQLDMQVNRLETGKNRYLERVRAVVACDVICRNMDVSAYTKDGKPFSWIVMNSAGKRVLRAHAPDAGEVLRALGVTKHVHSGLAELEGSFDDTRDNHPFSGRFVMKDFTVTDAPILTRLLSLMSLSGLANALTGEGMGFAKMSMNVGYADGALRVDEGKSYGTAVGITVKGTLQPFAKRVDMQGTLVPAYAANSILGKIPVLGKLLTGGEGGGIIAANFSVRGNTVDPSVLVNPLSLLTPGFLRKLFDIAD
jgi:uncharacterized protein YhdP